MGQTLHCSDRTTETTRRAIRCNQESLKALAKRSEIDHKTVAKWKRSARLPIY
jgi:hypothetical protein